MKEYSSCEVIDHRDYQSYPLADEIGTDVMSDALDMKRHSLCVQSYVKKTEEGVPYVDVYMWDCRNEPEMKRRFVIREGCRFSDEDLEEFLSFTKDRELYMGVQSRLNLYFQSKEVFPEWNLSLIGLELAGKTLEHMYFASHRSGPLEILYKAGLDYIAYYYERIPGCRVDGRRPTEIIGRNMPLKLLRILNDPEFIENLYREESMAECAAIYRQYASYMGRGLPTERQWNYLKDLYRDGNTCRSRRFNRQVYQCLGEIMIPIRNIPINAHPQHAHGPLYCLDLPECPDGFRCSRKRQKHYDQMIRARKFEEQHYEYENGEYRIVLPESYEDLCREAEEQKNCLKQYIRPHAERETTILFLRKLWEPDRAYVTMEVDRKNRITQVYRRNNRDANKYVLSFIAEYAREKGFLFEERRHRIEELYDLEDLFDDLDDDIDWDEEDLINGGM